MKNEKISCCELYIILLLCFIGQILYFAWADQRDKVSVLYFPYSSKGAVWKIRYSYVENTVQLMQIVVIVLGVKFLSITTVTTDFKLNPLLIL